MLIYIHESGDAGFKMLKGSSLSFVVSLVIFDDDLDAEETALKIKRLRKKLGKTEKFEFKFNKCNRELREAFLQEIRSCKFRVRSVVFRKSNLQSSYFKKSKDKFYNFALKLVLEHNNDTIRDAQIRLDGQSERDLKRNLGVYLRKNLNSHLKSVIKQLKFKDSQRDVLIQLADMIAGSIRRSFDNSTNDSTVYRKIIQKKEEDTWVITR